MSDLGKVSTGWWLSAAASVVVWIWTEPTKTEWNGPWAILYFTYEIWTSSEAQKKGNKIWRKEKEKDCDCLHCVWPKLHEGSLICRQSEWSEQLFLSRERKGFLWFYGFVCRWNGERDCNGNPWPLTVISCSGYCFPKSALKRHMEPVTVKVLCKWSSCQVASPWMYIVWMGRHWNIIKTKSV